MPDALPKVDLSAVPAARCVPARRLPGPERRIRHVFPWGQAVHGRRFPRGAGYRKHWNAGFDQAVGALRGGATVAATQADEAAQRLEARERRVRACAGELSSPPAPRRVAHAGSDGQREIPSAPAVTGQAAGAFWCRETLNPWPPSR